MPSLLCEMNALLMPIIYKRMGNVRIWILGPSSLRYGCQKKKFLFCFFHNNEWTRLFQR